MKKKERDAILEAAVAAYGQHDQEDMMIEEMSELTKAILKLRRTSAAEAETDEELRQILVTRRADIIEEMADVQIMLDQLRIIYGDTTEAEDFKLVRLAGRLDRYTSLRQEIAEAIAVGAQIPRNLAAKILGIPQPEGGDHDE